jgi:hypothetical protein
MDIQGLTLEPYLLAFIPLINFLTYIIFKVTPKTFNNKKFGPLVSLGISIIVSILDSFWHPFNIWASVLRGMILAGIANGIYDHIKSGKSISNGKDISV